MDINNINKKEVKYLQLDQDFDKNNHLISSIFPFVTRIVSCTSHIIAFWLMVLTDKAGKHQHSNNCHILGEGGIMWTTFFSEPAISYKIISYQLLFIYFS